MPLNNEGSDGYVPKGTAVYGRYYWCVKVPKNISKNGEIYLMADRVSVENGALHFWRKREDYQPNLILPSGGWIAVYAASAFDGSAVAVERWAGEVERDGCSFA